MQLQMILGNVLLPLYYSSNIVDHNLFRLILYVAVFY